MGSIAGSNLPENLCPHGPPVTQGARDGRWTGDTTPEGGAALYGALKATRAFYILDRSLYFEGRRFQRASEREE